MEDLLKNIYMFLLNCATAIIKCCLYVCCYQNVTNGNKWILYCIVLYCQISPLVKYRQHQNDKV